MPAMTAVLFLHLMLYIETCSGLHSSHKRVHSQARRTAGKGMHLLSDLAQDTEHASNFQSSDKQGRSPSSEAVARHSVQLEARAPALHTYDYLLKTPAQPSGADRCHSIVEVKRL